MGTSKYIAPTVILLCTVLTAAGGGFLYYSVFKAAQLPAIFRIITVTATIGVTGILTAVFIQRVKEIRQGEEDDLGKY